MNNAAAKNAGLAAIFGVQDASRIGIVMGIFTMIFGMLSLMAPHIAGFSVNMLVAVALVATGIARLVFAFKAENFGSGLIVFLFGGLSIATGAIMFASPKFGLSTLTMVLAVFFVVDGIIEIIASFQAKPVQGWGWGVFSGLASGALGIMVLSQWPESTAWAIGTLVGVRLLFAGSSMLFFGTAGEVATQDVLDEVGKN